MAQPLRPTIVARHTLPWLCALGFLSALASGLAAQQTALTAGQPNLEYRVKAAFLLNFTKFIEWPQDQSGSDTPLTICILGEDPFGPILDEMVDGESANGRKVSVRRSRHELPRGCQILYIAKPERSTPQILAEAGRAVLTVGEGENFLREGGMIAFILENRRVRFAVSLAAARNSLLKFSSKLLSVAKVVENVEK